MRVIRDVVYVTHDSLAEGIGMSQIVPLLIGYADKGLRVGVISCEKVKAPIELQQTLGQHGIYWKPIKFGRYGPLGGLGRVFRLAFFLPRAKVFHCRGDISATATSIRTRKPFIWDVRGLWLDQKIILSGLERRVVIIRVAKFLEKRAAAKATAVTTLTSAVYPVLRRRHPNLTRNHSVIPTCVDLTKFSFSPIPPQKRNLLLSGVFNDYYDLEKTKKFTALLKRDSSIHITWCHGKEAMRESLGVGEDEIKTLTQPEMPKEIANSSFGLAICKENSGESLLGVMPTKVAEFLATGRPVVVSAGIGDLDSMLIEFGAGVVLSASLEHDINLLEKLLLDPQTSYRCRALAEFYFSMDLAVNKYYRILSDLGIDVNSAPNEQ
jgi:glycosyltransferase involved in cell wall biosynthesis